METSSAASKIKQFLGITETRYPSVSLITIEITSTFTFANDTVENSTIEEIDKFCKTALYIFGEQIQQKKLFFVDKTNPSDEAAANFKNKMEHAAQHLLSQHQVKVILESLWKLLCEEFWWRMFGINNYHDFVKVPIKQTKSQASNRKILVSLSAAASEEAVKEGTVSQNEEVEEEDRIEIRVLLQENVTAPAPRRPTTTETLAAKQSRFPHKKFPTVKRKLRKAQAQIQGTEASTTISTPQSTEVTEIPEAVASTSETPSDPSSPATPVASSTPTTPATPTTTGGEVASAAAKPEREMRYYDILYRSEHAMFAMSKQAHETIRYMIWGYHYALESFKPYLIQSNELDIQSNCDTWWLKPISNMISSFGEENLRNIVMLDMDNVGACLGLLASRNFDYPNTLFFGICGPKFKLTESIAAWLNEYKDRLLLYRVQLDQPRQSMNALEEYLFGFYEVGVFKKWKDAADHGISAIVGALHRILPLQTKFWVGSRDEGLEHPVRHVLMRGRHARRFGQRDMASLFDEYILERPRLNQFLEQMYRKSITAFEELDVTAAPKEAEEATPETKETQNESGAISGAEQDEQLPWEFMNPADLEKMQRTTLGVEFGRQQFEDEFGLMLKEYIMGDTKKQLSSLKLRVRKLGVTGLRNMLPAVPIHMNHITHIELRGNRICDQGTAELMQALKGNQVLTYLDLASCAIGDKGAVELANFITESKAIRVLDLRWNKVAVRGAKALAHSLLSNESLVVLYLRENRIGYAGGKALMECVSKMKNSNFSTLDIRNTSREEEQKDIACAFGEFLKSNAEKTSSETVLFDRLMGLDLNGNFVKPEGAKELARFLLETKNSAMMRLCLDYNQIGSALPYLSKFLMTDYCSLVVLTLARNDIQDDDVIPLSYALERNDTITWLDLQRNNISNRGVHALSKALHKNQTVSTLNLKHNRIGDAGIVHLASAIQDNVAISSLDISANFFGKEGCSALTAALAHNQVLQELYISVNKKIGDGSIQKLAKAAFRNGSSILKLELEQTNVRYEGINSICDHLESQTTTFQQLATDSAAPGCTGFEKQFCILNLSGNRLGYHRIEKVADHLLTPWLGSSFVPKYESLHRLCKTLSMAQHIQHLDIGANDLGDKGLELLCQSSHALDRSRSLAYLNLSANDITAAGTVHLAKMLSVNQSLTSINIAENMIGDEGIVAIAQGLVNNSTLTYLRASHNHISSVGAKAVSDLILQKPESINTMAVVDLHNNDIDDEGAKHLAVGVEKSTALTILNVERNPIKASGAAILYGAGQRIISDYAAHSTILLQVSI